MEDETTTRMVNLRRRMDRDNRHLACLVVIRGPILGERFILAILHKNKTKKWLK